MEQNNSIFNRLKKVFSTGTVIRSTGDDNRIKTVDVDHIQNHGENNENKGVYSTLQEIAAYDLGSSYRYMRPQIYKDYEIMDQDAIISSALDILADECVLRNEIGEILTIKTPNEEIKDKLENLFYDILNIEFNLWSWIRMMLKYGDFFIHLQISEQYGIYNVLPISPYYGKRDDNYQPNPELNPRTVFKVSYDNVDISNNNRDEEILENYEVAHFRLLTDIMYNPYGKSFIEPSRKIFKQLTLAEDALLIHRIMRAPEKRIFYIDVGAVKPNKVGEYMKRVQDNMKKAPHIDPQTGEYNLKYNMQNITEDFYIPVRGSNNNTKIDTLPGLQYNAIEDIEYLRDKLFAALKIPKAFMGYEKDIEGKATLAAEDIRFARTVERIQKIVISELTKIAIIHLYILGYDDEDLVDFELSLTSPSIIYEQEKIQSFKSKIELIRDMLETDMIPFDYIYKNILHINEDEYEEMKELVIEDKKFKNRISQIEETGEDPKKTSMSYNDISETGNLSRKKEYKGEPEINKNKSSYESPLSDDPIGRKRNNSRDNDFLIKELKDKLKRKEQ